MKNPTAIPMMSLGRNFCRHSTLIFSGVFGHSQNPHLNFTSVWWQVGRSMVHPSSLILALSTRARNLLHTPQPQPPQCSQSTHALCFSDSFSFSLPFTPKFLQINSPPVFFFVIVFVIFTGIRCGTDFFFVTPMRSSGSRVDVAQKPNKSGQILDQRWKICLVIFTKLIPRRNFLLYCKIFGVDGMFVTVCVFLFIFWRELEHSCAREMVNAHQMVHQLLKGGSGGVFMVVGWGL